jgi:hypothetical protein
VKYSALILRTEVTVTIQFTLALHIGAEERSYYDLSRYGREWLQLIRWNRLPPYSGYKKLHESVRFPSLPLPPPPRCLKFIIFMAVKNRLCPEHRTIIPSETLLLPRAHKITTLTRRVLVEVLLQQLQQQRKWKDGQ